MSTAGHQGRTGNIGYYMSRSGLLNFTRTAAMDLSRRDFRANSLTSTATGAEESGARAQAWGRARPEPRGRMLDFQKMVPIGKAAESPPFRAGGSLSRLGRCGDDHGLRPSGGAGNMNALRRRSPRPRSRHGDVTSQTRTPAGPRSPMARRTAASWSGPGNRPTRGRPGPGRPPPRSPRTCQ